jgi:phage-related tail fiber protein
MTSPTVDRRYGVVGGLGVKAPCAAGSTGNLTLSAEQTVNAIAVTDGDRVLVKSQTDSAENGIWVVSTGDWSRALDFDGNYDVTTGTLVYVTAGTTTVKGLWTVTAVAPIEIGTDDITFASVLLTT